MSIVKINEGTSKVRVIGHLDEKDKIFRKTVLKSKHLFRKFDAFGIDAQYFCDVLLPNDYRVQIWEKEENEVYEITAKEFKKHAVYFHFKNESDDHRSQVFCSRRFWLRLSKEDQTTRDIYLKYLV